MMIMSTIKGRLNRKIGRVRLQAFLRRYQSSLRTLDIGCGDSYYKNLFPNRVAFDIDPERKPDVIGDVHQLPFPNETFDIVVCIEVLEHLHTPSLALAEIQRVLRKNGLLLLTTRFIYPLHDTPHDYFRFTRYGLHHLLQGWRMVELEEETRSLEAIAVLLQRCLYQMKFKANIFVKGILFILMHLFLHLHKLVLAEFGNITQKDRVRGILSSGYYCAAKKP